MDEKVYDLYSQHLCSWMSDQLCQAIQEIIHLSTKMGIDKDDDNKCTYEKCPPWDPQLH